MAQQSFVKWVCFNARTLMGTGVVGAITVVLSSTDSIWGVMGRVGLFKYPYIWIYALQVVLVFVCLLLVPWQTALDRAPKLVAERLKNVRAWWCVLLVAWCITYMMYLMQEVLQRVAPSLTVPSWMLVVMAKVEICAFLGLYLSLSRGKAGRDVNLVTWVFVGLVLFVVLCLEIVIEAVAARGSYRGTVATSLSCSLLGVAVSMFVGRLDTHKIPIHPLVLFCCYAYAAIQPMFPLASNDFVLFLFAASLFFKSVLFMFLSYLVSTGLLQSYIAAHM